MPSPDHPVTLDHVEPHATEDPHPVSVERVVAIIGAYRFIYCDERQLHEALAGALAKHGITAAREVPLNAHDRIDLLVGRIGVEVKIAGVTTRVLGQLQRYAHSDKIDALVLVTTRARHLRLPPTVGGKPLAVASLLGGF
jgi:hypothetical protein